MLHHYLSFCLDLLLKFFIHYKNRYLILWWVFCHIVCFRVILSLSWDILFHFFLSSPLIWRSPLPKLPRIFMFPFLRAFWFPLYLLFHSFHHCHFPVLTFSMPHFFMTSSILIYWLFTMVSSSFSILGNSLITVITLLLRFSEFVSYYTFPKYVTEWHHRYYKCNSDIASPWNITIWIFISSCCQRHSPVHLRESIFQLCETIL